MKNHSNIQWLREQVQLWIAQGLIKADQAEQILAQYQYDAASLPIPWYRRTDFILKGLAALLIAMSVFLLIGSNWSILPIPFRMAVGLVPLFVSYYAAFRALDKGKKDNAELFLFLSSLLFGANIMLQAQIFHISSYYPDGVLWWILGTLPIMLVFNSTIHAHFVQAATLVWLGIQAEYEQFNFLAFLILLAIVYQLYRKPSKTSIFIFYATLFFLLINFIIHTNRDNHYQWLIFGYWVIGAAYNIFFISFLDLIGKDYEPLFKRRMTFICSLVIIFIAYLNTFKDFIDAMSRAYFSTEGLIIFLIAVLIYFLKNKWQRNDEFFALLLLFVMIILTSVSKEKAQLFFIVNNFIFLAYTIFEIYLGVVRKEKDNFFFGIVLFLFLAFARYLNYFDNYLMTSFVFTIAAILIFYLNKIWNKNIVNN